MLPPLSCERHCHACGTVVHSAPSSHTQALSCGLGLVCRGRSLSRQRNLFCDRATMRSLLRQRILCCNRELSVATKLFCRAQALVGCAPRACRHSRTALCHSLLYHDKTRPSTHPGSSGHCLHGHDTFVTCNARSRQEFPTLGQLLS